MAVSLFGITSMVTCISLLIFTFIPQLPLADDDIESSLRTAAYNASGTSNYLSSKDMFDCSIFLEYAASALELAIEKYKDGHFKDLIEQIKEAQDRIKSCQESPEGEILEQDLVLELAHLQLFVKKIKEEVCKINKCEV